MNRKGIFVKDIKENIRIEAMFLVKDKNNGITKNGKPYLTLNLSDKTGEVRGQVWDNAEKFGQLFSQGDVIAVNAYSILYRGDIQLNINSIQKTESSDIVLSDFLPVSELDPEKTFNELISFVESVKNIHLKKLLNSVLDDSKIVAAFKISPAAKKIHHDYLGGLLEHTLNVVRLSDSLSKYYKNINRDILIAGAILHDIGKIHELSYDKNFNYTDRGRLIGHIVIGVEIISEKIKSLQGFPEDLANIIKHLILSHHGEYVFGSPKRPKTLEAFLLSYSDDIDARMYDIARFIEKEKKPDTRWSSFNKLHDRYIYTDTFVDGAALNDASYSKNKNG